MLPLKKQKKKPTKLYVASLAKCRSNTVSFNIGHFTNRTNRELPTETQDLSSSGVKVNIQIG